MLNVRNLLLLSFAVLAMYLLSRVSSTSTESVTSDVLPEQDFDYYITGMSNTRFDTTGKPTYKLEATRVTHYPDTDIAKMENPHFFYFDVEGKPWEVTATSGNLSNDPARNEEHLELFDDVVIHRPLKDGNFVTVTTQNLDVFPDSKDLMTDSPATLEARGTRLEGTGMRASFAKERIDLLNAVRGFHNE